MLSFWQRTVKNLLPFPLPSTDEFSLMSNVDESSTKCVSLNDLLELGEYFNYEYNVHYLIADIFCNAISARLDLTVWEEHL